MAKKKMRCNPESSYQGWTNYATWRVKLECFDGFDASEYYNLDNFDVGGLADELKELVNQQFVDELPDGLAKGWVEGFLEEVNWKEIAQWFLDDYEEQQTDDDTRSYGKRRTKKKS